jgi:hypothetical protein
LRETQLCVFGKTWTIVPGQGARDALAQGLEVSLSPELRNRSPQATLAYLTKAAAAAQTLHEHWPGRVVLSVGSELTLFMRGIVPGRTLTRRLAHPSFWENAKLGTHNEPLNAFIWEKVDWSVFDFIGVDHYREARIEDRYLEMLQPLFAHGKPVVVTEFGMLRSISARLDPAPLLRKN